MTVTLPPNRFKRAIAAGEKQIGFWLTLASPAATEIAATAGFDWLLIDMEHSINELPDVVHHLRAAVGGTAEPMVRVPWNEPVAVKRLLDAGVRTLMFPYVQSADEARRAVAATRYPPAGIRGFSGGARAQVYGRVPDYAKRAHEEICVVVQIESPKAVAAIPEIAAVDGVDGIFIGPNDLAANMGHLANPAAPEVQKEILRALDLIEKSGKAAGMLQFREEEAKKLIEAGYGFVAVNGDATLLARGTEQLVKAYKGR